MIRRIMSGVLAKGTTEGIQIEATAKNKFGINRVYYNKYGVRPRVFSMYVYSDEGFVFYIYVGDQEVFSRNIEGKGSLEVQIKSYELGEKKDAANITYIDCAENVALVRYYGDILDVYKLRGTWIVEGSV